MLIHRLDRLIRSQRGIALPMALLTMLILSALIIAFSMMAATEPVLANNQLQVAQARALAESGVERAIWALNNPTNASGIPNPLVTPAAPYAGVTATPVTVSGNQMGVFTVSVINNALDASARDIVSTGWTPTNTGTGPKVKQKIQVTVLTVRGFGDLPSPLTVRGEIDVGGNALIDSRADKTCGNKTGSTSLGFTTWGGNAKVFGAEDGNTTGPNFDKPNQPTDIIQDAPNSLFDQYTYSYAELNALKALAKRNGTYYQGDQTFNSSRRIPNGIVYVDSVSGKNIDEKGKNTTAIEDFASLTIRGNAPLDASGIFKGMLIVAGSLRIDGDFQMWGLAYVLNDFVYLGTGTGQIVGGVMSQNVRDISATTVDTTASGNSTILWNCANVRNGGGYLPPTFTIETGTYKEISG